MRISHLLALLGGLAAASIVASTMGCASAPERQVSLAQTFGSLPENLRPPPDAKLLSSGVGYKVLRQGDGQRHTDAGSLVRVAYSGWQSDGTLFDSSQSHGKPQIFDLPKVVRGLSQGIVQMVEGEVAKFWIPADLAYGESPPDARLPAGPLVFEIELLNIVRQ